MRENLNKTIIWNLHFVFTYVIFVLFKNLIWNKYKRYVEIKEKKITEGI